MQTAAVLPRTAPGAARLRRVHGLALCVALVLGLGGCISTKFLFNQLDLFVFWQLNGLFSLEPEQESALRETVRRNLDWVRREQLPQYAVLARQISADTAAGEVTAATARQRYLEMVQLWDAFLRQVTPDAARFLGSLNDAQVKDFLDNLEEENQELWDEYAGETPEERVRRRQKAAIKASQRLTGRLDGSQRELVGAYVASMHDNSAEWLEGRREWQKRFRALLLERPPETEYTLRLQDLLLNPNATDAADYRRQVEENLDTVFDMLAALAASLSDRQRDRMVRRLEDYARDFDALAAQTG